MSSLPWANKAGIEKKVFSTTEVQSILKLANNLSKHEQIDSHGGPWVYLEKNKNKIARIEHFYKSDSKEWEPIINKMLKAVVGTNNSLFLFKDKVNYMYPNGRGFEPHQDISAGWAKYTPYHLTIGLPLVDTNTSNGCLWVAPLKKPGDILTETFTDLTDVQVPSKLYEPLCTSLGDVFYFDSCIPHRSYSNKSSEKRPILYMTFTLEDKYDDYHEDKWLQCPPTSKQKDGECYRQPQTFSLEK